VVIAWKHHTSALSETGVRFAADDVPKLSGVRVCAQGGSVEPRLSAASSSGATPLIDALKVGDIVDRALDDLVLSADAGETDQLARARARLVTSPRSTLGAVGTQPLTLTACGALAKPRDQ
jgi:hypothetical protein